MQPDSADSAELGASNTGGKSRTVSVRFDEAHFRALDSFRERAGLSNMSDAVRVLTLSRIDLLREYLDVGADVQKLADLLNDAPILRAEVVAKQEFSRRFSAFELNCAKAFATLAASLMAGDPHAPSNEEIKQSFWTCFGLKTVKPKDSGHDVDPGTPGE